MTGFEILAAFTLGFLVLYFLQTSRRKNLPPGPWWSYPFVGHLPLLGAKPYKTLQEWTLSGRFGPLIYLNFGSFPTVVINDAKLMKEAMNRQEFAGRPQIQFFKDRSGGKAKGLIFTDGAKWEEQRRFTLRHLRDFGFGKKSMEAIIQEEASELIERFRKEIGQPMSTTNAFNAAILNALWQILTGERFKQDDPELLSAIKMLTTSIQENNTLQGVATFLPWLAKWFPNVSGYREMLKDVVPVTSFIWKTIPHHQETFQEGENRDFLDMYISETRKTTDPASPFHSKNSEMDWVLVDLFIAGTETTSTTLAWSFIYLAKHPEVQKKLQQEIDKIVGNSRMPSVADRPLMHYTQAVMHETLRYASFIPFSVFHSTTQETELAGYTLPKDTMVFQNLYAVHHDPKIWGDPENYRPERFLNNKGEFQKHDCFMAFSTGKRVCLGETLARDEYFIFLTSLFQRFGVKAASEINLDPFVGMVLSPKPHQFILNERY